MKNLLIFAISSLSFCVDLYAGLLCNGSNGKTYKVEGSVDSLSSLYINNKLAVKNFDLETDHFSKKLTFEGNALAGREKGANVFLYVRNMGDGIGFIDIIPNYPPNEVAATDKPLLTKSIVSVNCKNF